MMESLFYLLLGVGIAMIIVALLRAQNSRRKMQASRAAFIKQATRPRPPATMQQVPRRVRQTSTGHNSPNVVSGGSTRRRLSDDDITSVPYTAPVVYDSSSSHDTSSSHHHSGSDYSSGGGGSDYSSSSDSFSGGSDF